LGETALGKMGRHHDRTERHKICDDLARRYAISLALQAAFRAYQCRSCHSKVCIILCSL